MSLVSPALIAFAIAFLVVAAIAAVVTIGVVANSVVTNRRTRLSRHESIRSYYGGLVLSH